MKYKTSKALAIIVMNIVVAAALKAGPPGPEVGEPGSFGHNILYMGAASGFIRLSNACTPAPTPVPPMTANNDQCFVLNPQPAPTDFDAPDICRIMLPKKATRTIIYPTLNFFVNYELKNQTGAPQPNGVFNFFAVISIESDALLDPSIIDPATGDPANGKLTGVFTYNYRDDQTMDTGARQRHQLTLVRAGNAGINKASLVAQGLSQAVVDNLFNSAMTLRMSVSGRGQLLTDPGTATITPNMRLFGD